MPPVDTAARVCRGRDPVAGTRHRRQHGGVRHVDSFVLHPFAFPDADRLLVIGPSFPKLSSETAFIEVLSPLEYEDFRHARSFASTAAFDLGNRNISGGDVPDRVFTAFMIDNAFPVVGLRPFLGRGFTSEELQR